MSASYWQCHDNTSLPISMTAINLVAPDDDNAVRFSWSSGSGTLPSRDSCSIKVAPAAPGIPYTGKLLCDCQLALPPSCQAGSFAAGGFLSSLDGRKKSSAAGTVPCETLRNACEHSSLIQGASPITRPSNGVTPWRRVTLSGIYGSVALLHGFWVPRLGTKRSP